jgi:hypothetical protein
MKQVLFFVAMLSLILLGCKKSDSSKQAPTSLEGKWKMINVNDNTTGLITTKSTSTQNDVIITFTLANLISGTFIGNTPTNEIGKNSFSIGTNQTIIIPVLAMTKIGETPWGILFVDNICSSQEYAFEIGGILKIKTTNKTLSFLKQ